MRRFLLLNCLVFCIAACSADYYVSNLGDDSAVGTSAEHSWKTLTKVNATDLNPGDRIFLQGGGVFEGALTFKRGGTKDKPIIISSYGDGLATIKPSKTCGIQIENCAGFSISKLIIAGSGAETHDAHGIYCLNNLPGDVKLEALTFDELEISGFKRCGIEIFGDNKQSGFDNVRITNCSVHGNGQAAISSNGYCPEDFQGWSHSNFYIGYCKAWDNRGIPNKSDNHSGNGIVIGGVDRVVIEYCESFDNGSLCNCKIGGPVGIWVWDCNRATIQMCESHHNRTGKPSVDGGGFDLDGGVTKSVIQYCYSHDNDGAGFLLAQYKGARKFESNTIRFNVSQNDGRAHGYGGMFIWTEKPGEIKNIDIYNNTIFVSPAPSGTPAGLKTVSLVKNVRVFNNIFVTKGGVPLISSNQDEPGITFAGNAYFSGGDQFIIQWKKQSFKSLESWREATRAETLDGKPVGFAGDPGLQGAGEAKTIHDCEKLVSLGEYRLKDDSPLLKSGLNLQQLFNIDIGERDFFGGKTNKTEPSVGACQKQ